MGRASIVTAWTWAVEHGITTTTFHIQTPYPGTRHRWSSIAQASLSHGSVKHQAKHFFAAGWKKFEPAWDVVIRAKQLRAMTPMLERVLSKVTATPDRGRGESARPRGLVQKHGGALDAPPCEIANVRV